MHVLKYGIVWSLSLVPLIGRAAELVTTLQKMFNAGLVRQGRNQNPLLRQGRGNPNQELCMTHRIQAFRQITI